MVDINNDGVISLLDVTAFNRYLSGNIELVDYVRADLNANCVVDAVDSEILLRYITESNIALPYTNDGGGSSYASVGATSVNTLTGYTVFDATSGDFVYGYTLDANAITDNSRIVIGNDGRYRDDSLSGVVKILVSYVDDFGITRKTWGSGFVVDSHTIATAAHCVYKKRDNDPTSFQDAIYSIEKILVLNNLGNVQLEITGMYDVHVPNGYISKESPNHWGYDYAMITVSEDLTAYAKFNLGIMTDGMMSDSEKVYCTGFPETVENPDGAEEIVNNTTYLHQKFTGEGYIQADVANEMPERRFCHNADTFGGNSGGPVYVESVLGTNTYYTVIGIHTYGNRANEVNGGTQMTTNMLHFYKNNPNIYWGS
jgi:V8-like Glu-specific endopeptidase